MKMAKSTFQASILSATLIAASTATIASDAGLPPSTNWQAWNDYVSQPSHSQGHKNPTGMPSSTNWQSWNKYTSQSGHSQKTMTQKALPSSTNWQQWNQYIATTK